MSKFRVASLTYKGVEYKYLLYNFNRRGFFAISMQKERPEIFKSARYLYGVYNYYELINLSSDIKETGLIESKDITAQMVGASAYALITKRLEVKKLCINDRRCVAYRLSESEKSKLLGYSEKSYLYYFGLRGTIFLYSSIGRTKLDLLILFMYLIRIDYYNLSEFVVHLPADEEYIETYNEHIDYLDFQVVTEYENYNSENTVYIMKKSLRHE